MKEKMLGKRIAAGIAAIMTAATLCACDDLDEYDDYSEEDTPNRQLLPVQRKSPKLSATDHLKALTAEAQS